MIEAMGSTGGGTPYATPLLRVSRPVSACSRCRSAKVKCDGKLPTCTACERAGKAHECTGGSDQFARGKERSYLASLESKVERLEKRLAMIERKERERGITQGRNSNGAGANNVNGYPTPGSQGVSDYRHRSPTSPKPSAGRKSQVEASEIESLVADLGYMAINAVTRDFHGFTNVISFARVVLKASQVSRALDMKPRAGLPERHYATQLVQHYFDKIFTTLPCLNEASFFGALDAVYRDQNSASAFDIFCVYMVLAVGTMSLSRSQDSAAHQAACFVKTALEQAEAVITPSEIRGVQATLLLVQYSMLEPAHFNSWYLIGVASRIMIDIGLHQEPLELSKRKPAEMDLRRRIFYCVYSLDRSISMVLQRPFTFSDDSVRVELPAAPDPALASCLSPRGTLTPMAAALHLFKLRRLQSDWYQTLHLCGDAPLDNAAAYLQHHTQQLAAWKDTIPTTLNAHTHDWLLLEWHYLNIYIAAPSPKTPTLTPDALRQVYTHCIAYPTAFRAILGNQSKNRFVYTYHDALRTYFVGSNLLHALHHAMPLLLPAATPIAEFEKAADAISATLSVLGSMIVRWPEAEALRDKFRAGAEVMLERIGERVRTVLEEEQEMVERERREVWRREQEMWEVAALGGMGGLAGTAAAGGGGGAGWGWGGHVAMPDMGNVAFYRYG